MIDHLSFKVPYRGTDINGGHMVMIKPGGEIHYAVDKHMMLEGSYSDKIFIRGYNGELYVRGNPTKFLQGHNLFGVNDLIYLASVFFCKLVHFLDKANNGQHIERDYSLEYIQRGLFHITRIDITESFSLGSRTDAKQWLSSALVYMQENRQKVTNEGSTIYIGKNSQRMTVKIYYKGDEIRKHPISVQDAELVKSLKNWANDKIRIEVTLRGKQLAEHIFCYSFLKTYRKNFTCKKQTLNNAYAWSPELIEQVYWHVIKEKVKLPKETKMTRIDLNRLSPAVRGVYLMWAQGIDVKSNTSQSAFYRHRRRILQEVGVDIKRQSPNEANTRNVVPLIRVLEAQPAEIPDWAFEYDLVACAN